MERARVVGIIAAATVVLSGASGAVWFANREEREPFPAPVPGDEIAITVEVLNGTATDGLARRTTAHLRSRGIDVVYYGSVRAGPVDTTVVFARRGDTLAAALVRDVLGVGVVRAEPAPERLLDVSVILGRDAAAVRFEP